MDFSFSTAIALNETEQKLKQLYTEFPNRYFQQPHTPDSVKDVFSLLNDHTPSDAIEEGLFISEGMDTAYVRHLRYLPAAWHRHEFFEVLYVINGSCLNSFANRTIEMCRGDICISAPGSEHAISAFSDDDMLLNILIRRSTFERSFLGLMDDDDILGEFFRRVLYSTEQIPFLLFHTARDEALLDIISKAYSDYMENQRFRRPMQNSLLTAFFVTLLRNHEDHVEVPQFSLRSSDKLVTLLRYIQSNYDSVTLKELSAVFSYSERQIQRMIETSTGLSFSEIVQRGRMKKAVSLLRETDLSIEEICGRAGYQSANNFRRIFYNHFGCTPREYRKQSK